MKGKPRPPGRGDSLYYSMVLYIDTTDFNKATFAVLDGKKVFKRVCKIDQHRSHETLGLLDQFLKSQKIRNPQSAIAKIVVNKGPGSYTGVRVGVTIAMALGFAWGAKVSALSAADFTLIGTRI